MMLVVKSGLSLLFPVFFLRLLIIKWFFKSKVIVLIFHEVEEQDLGKFKRIIKFIDMFFEFIEPEIFEQFIRGDKKIRGVQFLVTFDDGFISSKNAVVKVLDPMKIKAALFVCSDYVRIKEKEIPEFIKNNLFFTADDSFVTKDRWPMRSNDLIELHLNGHKIGAHSVSHKVLSKIDEEQMEKEVREVKDELGKLLQTEVNWFAYPFGGVDFIDGKSMFYIKKAYEYNFSGLRGEVSVGQNKLIIPRCSVNIRSGFIHQLAEIVGVTNFIHLSKIKKIEQLQYKKI